MEPNIDLRTGLGSGTDLSSCTGLRTLFLALTPQFSMDKHGVFVKDLLGSWKPRCLEPVLKFAALREDGFARQGFADVLHSLGIIVEAWLQTIEKSHPAGERAAENNSSDMQYQLYVEIYDWEAERKWWSDHLESCFPTWSRLRRLRWRLCTRKHIPNAKCSRYPTGPNLLHSARHIRPMGRREISAARDYPCISC